MSVRRLVGLVLALVVGLFAQSHILVLRRVAPGHFEAVSLVLCSLASDGVV